MLKLALLFGDHMVLQRDTQAPIWGTCFPNDKVTITFQKQIKSTKADKSGYWRIILDPLSVDTGLKMQISTSTESKELKDIAVGDVWFAGGQSNMEFQMQFEDHYQREKLLDNKNIRFFDFPEITYVDQLKERDYLTQNGFWRIDNRENLNYFSAVGYYFAKQLQANLNIPIGILGCNFGGTSILAWMSKQAIIKGNGKKYLNEYLNKVVSLDLNEYWNKFKASDENYHTDLLEDKVSNQLLYGWNISEINLRNDSIAQPPKKILGPADENTPSVLYEAMVKQINPYAIKGFIWYQGENDAALNMENEEYHDLFIELINSYRKLWKDNQLPFLFVQLAPFKEWFGIQGDFSNIRRQQQEVADEVKNTGMAVITDCGAKDDIHPKNKELVGQRLANLAERKVYNLKIEDEAPRLKMRKIDGKWLKLYFYHGQNLRGSYDLPYIQVSQGKQELIKKQVLYINNQIWVKLDNYDQAQDLKIKIAETPYYEVRTYNSDFLPLRPAEVRIKQKEN